MAKSHRAGGVAAWLGSCAALGVPIGWAAAGTPVAWSASLWPDWDHDQATLARSMFGVSYKFSRWVERRFGGHRAGTHSVLVGVPLAGLVAFPMLAVGLLSRLWRESLAAVVTIAVAGRVGGWWWTIVVVSAAGMVGALSHVLLDCLTCNCSRCDPDPRRPARVWRGHRTGCEVAWPASERRFGVRVGKVGGEIEGAATMGAWVGAAAAALLVVVGG